MRIFKQTLGMVAFLLSTIFLAGCAKDVTLEASKPGSVNISFISSALKSGDSVNVSGLVVSINDANGVAVYENKVIKLYNFNGSYTGEALSLAAGKYAIVSFMVIDANNKVVYLSPKAGSTKASFVKQALPIWFEIQPNVSTSLAPEVVRPEGQATDYGYAQFGFTVVDENPKVDSICLRVGTLNKMAFVNAKIIVSSEAGITSIAYSGWITTIHVPKSKLGYKVQLVQAAQSSTSKGIFVSASDAAKYSCETNNLIDFFNPPAVTSYFETLYYYASSTGPTVTFSKDGGITSSAMNTLLPIIMSAADKASLDSVLRSADVYNIKESEIQCEMIPLDNSVVSISGALGINKYRSWFTGGCGLSAQAKVIDAELKRLIAKYIGNINPVKSDYVINVGQSFSISLESNATTGYSWTWASKADNSILAASNMYVTNTLDSAKVGAGGVDTWTFTGLKAGTTTVLLYYQRSFDASSIIEKKSITVTVQ